MISNEYLSVYELFAQKLLLPNKTAKTLTPFRREGFCVFPVWDFVSAGYKKDIFLNLIRDLNSRDFNLLIIVHLSVWIINTFFQTFSAIAAFIINNRRIKTILIFYKGNMFTDVAGIAPRTST